jgi:hypothetical protein
MPLHQLIDNVSQCDAVQGIMGWKTGDAMATDPADLISSGAAIGFVPG